MKNEVDSKKKIAEVCGFLKRVKTLREQTKLTSYCSGCSGCG